MVIGYDEEEPATFVSGNGAAVTGGGVQQQQSIEVALI